MKAEQDLHLQRIHELKAWSRLDLLRAKAWWTWNGPALCGEQATFNALGQIQGALNAK
jgi:hypothetical protein